MNNLYNLFENFNFYLEAFRNIESNKKFVSNDHYEEEVIHFFRLLKYLKDDNDWFSKNKIKEKYDSALKILESLSNDQVFYDQIRAFFSIDLEKENIEELKKLFEKLHEKLENASEDILEDINNLIDFIKGKLFIVTIDPDRTEDGFEIYDIIFSNLKYKTNSPQDSKEKGLISKNYRIIFGVILGFAEKLNIDFDESIFHFSGTIEGEKDNDKNRRLQAYHLAHRGFLSMKYGDIDEKELKNAFDNKEVHPFLYRVNKDEMYISVSEKVDLTEVFDNDEKNKKLREDAWPEFVEDFIESPEGLEAIQETLMSFLKERYPNIKNIVETLFPQRTIWDDFVHDTYKTTIDIEKKIDEFKDIVIKVRNKDISIKDFNNNEELINKIEDKNIINLINNSSYNIPKLYSLLIEEDIIQNDINDIDVASVVIDILKNMLREALENVKEDFFDQHFDDFMSGAYDHWIRDRGNM